MSPRSKQPKKPPSEMTDEELLQYVFPNKKTRDKLRQIAHAEKPQPRKKK
jgi:hypothetical protein